MAISVSFFMCISIGKAVGVLAVELKFGYLPEGETAISPDSTALVCASLMVFQWSTTSSIFFPRAKALWAVLSHQRMRCWLICDIASTMAALLGRCADAAILRDIAQAGSIN